LNEAIHFSILEPFLELLPAFFKIVEIQLLDFLATFKDVAKMFQVDFGPFNFQLFKVDHFSNGAADKASWHPVAIVELENCYCRRVLWMLLKEGVPRTRLSQEVVFVVDIDCIPLSKIK